MTTHALGREEWIEGAGRARALPAYAAMPPGARRGVVIVHEILGRQPEIDRVVERFATRGYAAVAPDLFHEGSRPACLVRMIRAAATGQGPMVEQTRRTRDWLCERTGMTPSAVGLVGFCLGGQFALAIGRGWGAVSTNYGGLPPDELLRGIGPTIGCYGARDKIFGALGPMLERRLGALGTEVEAHTFDGVGHSFLTDGSHPVLAAATRPFFHVEYHPAVAEAAWEKIMGFLDRQLAPAA